MIWRAYDKGIVYISLCKISEKKSPKYSNTAKIKTKTVTMIMMIMINCFCRMVAERRSIKHWFHLEPFIQGSQHHKPPTNRKQDLNLPKPESRDCWIKLSSGDKLCIIALCYKVWWWWMKELHFFCSFCSSWL